MWINISLHTFGISMQEFVYTRLASFGVKLLKADRSVYSTQSSQPLAVTLLIKIQLKVFYQMHGFLRKHLTPFNNIAFIEDDMLFQRNENPFRLLP